MQEPSHPSPPPPPPPSPRPPRRRRPGRNDEISSALILLAAGVGAYVVAGYELFGQQAAWAIFARLGSEVALGVALAILGCYVAGAVMNIDFGPLNIASLKLAAAFVFPSAVGTFLFAPPFAVIVSAILYFLILSWLFDLNLIDTIILAAMIAGVRLLVLIIIHAAVVVLHG